MKTTIATTTTTTSRATTLLLLGSLTALAPAKPVPGGHGHGHGHGHGIVPVVGPDQPNPAPPGTQEAFWRSYNNARVKDLSCSESSPDDEWAHCIAQCQGTTGDESEALWGANGGVVGYWTSEKEMEGKGDDNKTTPTTSEVAPPPASTTSALPDPTSKVPAEPTTEPTTSPAPPSDPGGVPPNETGPIPPTGGNETAASRAKHVVPRTLSKHRAKHALKHAQKAAVLSGGVDVDVGVGVGVGVAAPAPAPIPVAEPVPVAEPPPVVPVAEPVPHPVPVPAPAPPAVPEEPKYPTIPKGAGAGGNGTGDGTIFRPWKLKCWFKEDWVQKEKDTADIFGGPINTAGVGISQDVSPKEMIGKGVGGVVLFHDSRTEGGDKIDVQPPASPFYNGSLVAFSVKGTLYLADESVPPSEQKYISSQLH